MEFLKLKREITLFQATTFGLGALIGAGIFVLIGPAVNLAGPMAIFVYLLAGFSAFLSALTYAELSSTYLQTGGEYSFTKEILNHRFAFLVGWLLTTGSAVACAVYALGFAYFFGALFNFSSPWIAFIIFLLVSVLNIIGVKKTAAFEFYFTLILCFALIVFGIQLLFSGSISSFTFRFSHHSLMNVFQGVALVYISFFGFQVIATSAEEIKDPSRNIPKAIIFSSAIASLIYLLIVIGLVGINGRISHYDPAVFLEKSAEIVWGQGGIITITVLGLLATITSLNATILAISRRVYAVAKDRYIPELLATIHPKFKTPHLAIVFIFIVISPFIFTKSLTWAANLAAFSYLLSLSFIHLLLIFSRKKHPERERGFRLALFPLIPICGIITNLGILVFLDGEVLFTGTLWLILGVLLFEILRRREAGWQKINLWYQRAKLRVWRRGNIE